MVYISSAVRTMNHIWQDYSGLAGGSVVWFDMSPVTSSPKNPFWLSWIQKELQEPIQEHVRLAWGLISTETGTEELNPYILI